MAYPEKNSSAPKGSLFVVATPIGNLEDITFRAVETLKQVDLVVAEDTRRTGRLLKHYGVETSLCAMFEHNEAAMIPQLITRLEKGANMALVSDAGTPTLSDPGYRLIKAAVSEEIQVIPIPGVSAAIAGLSVSGLPTDAFLFVGFAERKQSRLENQLKQLATERHTLIFYESPKRIIALIEAMVVTFGDRPSMLGREMTKMHESYYRGTLSEVKHQLEKMEVIKGECTLVVGGAVQKELGLTEDELDQLLYIRVSQTEQPLSALVRELAADLAISKNILYSKVLAIQSELKSKVIK